MISSAGKKKEQPASASFIRRRLPIGAEFIPGRGVHFRVWSPLGKKMAVVLKGPVMHAGQETCLAAVGVTIVEIMPIADFTMMPLIFSLPRKAFNHGLTR